MAASVDWALVCEDRAKPRHPHSRGLLSCGQTLGCGPHSPQVRVLANPAGVTCTFCPHFSDVEAEAEEGHVVRLHSYDVAEPDLTGLRGPATCCGVEQVPGGTWLGSLPTMSPLGTLFPQTNLPFEPQVPYLK